MQSAENGRVSPIVFTLGVALLLLALGRWTGAIKWLESGIYEALYRPARVVLHTPAQSLRAFRLQHQTREYANAQAEALFRENQTLRANLLTLTHLQAENRRLRSLMESVLEATDAVQVAEVIDSVMDGQRESVWINRGEHEGVFATQAVIDAFGLVGQVVLTRAFDAEVMLISDVRSRVPVFIARTQQRELVAGAVGRAALEPLILPPLSDVVVGDVLVSSGLGGGFPRGYPVAKVISIETDGEGGLMRASIAPVAKLQSALEVLLLEERTVHVPPLPVGPIRERENR